MMKVTINEAGTYYVVAKNTISGYVSLPSKNFTFYTTENKFCTIGDIFSNPYESGIFQILRDSDTSLGEFLKTIYPDSISDRDCEYIFKRSGNKKLSSLIEGFILTRKKIGDAYPFSTMQIKIISRMFNAKYYDKWSDLYKTITEKFDALSPYNMEIEDTLNDTYNSTDNSSYNDTSDNTDNVYGFNNSSPQPQSSGNNNANGNSETTRIRTSSSEHKITRKGNIGNISMQDLTKKQREMLEWQFWDVVFSDTDKLLTRPTYR